MKQRPDRPVRRGRVIGLALALGLVFLPGIFLQSLTWSRKAKLAEITSNLEEINFAKAMWAADHSATTGVLASEQDLAKYLAPGRPTNFTGLVVSADSETYRANPIGIPPEAQLEKRMGRFPKGMVIRWSSDRGCEVLWPNPQGRANGWQPVYASTNPSSVPAAPRRSP